MFKFEVVYNIGDRVYIALPDGKCVIIIDIIYKVKSNNVLYECSDSEGNVYHCYSIQLSKEKIII